MNTDDLYSRACRRMSSPSMLAVVTKDVGGWQKFGERLVYDNQWVQLGLVDVQAPNGQRWEHHVVHLSRVAIALIVNERDEVLMNWRYRFPIDRWGYELFGGLVEEGEHPAETAAREAVEESGWRPVGEPEHLVSFEPLPGQVTSRIDVYLWRRAEHLGAPTDAEEAGRLEWMPVSRIPELVQRQLVPGAGALVSLLCYLVSRGVGEASRRVVRE
jgi:ADP-ribose pyrophosphatase